MQVTKTKKEKNIPSYNDNISNTPYAIKKE